MRTKHVRCLGSWPIHLQSTLEQGTNPPPKCSDRVLIKGVPAYMQLGEAPAPARDPKRGSSCQERKRYLNGSYDSSLLVLV